MESKLKFLLAPIKLVDDDDDDQVFRNRWTINKIGESFSAPEDQLA